MVGQIVFGGNSIYIPNVIVELDIGLTLIVETKGQYNDNTYLKAKAAERWGDALNKAGSFGLWQYVVAKDPTELPKILNDFCVSQWDAFDLWDITNFNLLHLKQAFIRYWVFLVLDDFVQEF